MVNNDRSDIATRIPRVPATAFRRPRLLDRLTAAPDIALVYGPIGAGKTTLLANWVNSATTPVLWCEPDDAGTLPWPEILPFAKQPGGGTLVIDRADAISCAEIDRLGEVIDRSPAIRVIVASRSARTGQHIAAASHAAIHEISPADLLMTLDDLRAADILADDQARLELLARTEGLVFAVRAELDDQAHGNTGATARLHRALRAAFNTITGGHHTALLLGLLPRVDAAVLAAWELPATLATELDDAGLAAWDGTWLRPHPFIYRVLADDAARELADDTRRQLISAAVHASLLTHDPINAFAAVFRLPDYDLATEIALANIVELCESRDQTYPLFRDVAPSKLRDYPALILVLILLSNMEPETRPRAIQILATESLFQRLPPQRGKARERVLFRAFEAVILRLTPFSKRALPKIRRSVEDLSVLPPTEMEALGRSGPLLLTHLGIGAFYASDLSLARRSFELAQAHYVESGYADWVDPLSLRGGLAALCGSMPVARELLTRADAADWPDGWRESSPADFLHLGQALLAFEAGDSAAMLRSLDAAMPMADMVEHWPLFALLRARYDRMTGNAERGLMQLSALRGKRPAPTPSMSKSFLDAAEAELHLALGNPDSAKRALARTAKDSALAMTVLARAELGLDRSAVAATVADRARQSRSATPRVWLEANIVLACAALRIGQTADAADLAVHIVSSIEETELCSPLRTVLPQDRAGIVALLRAAGLREEILDEVSASTTTFEAEVTPAPVLSPRELAVLEALVLTSSLDAVAEQLFVSRNTVKTHVSNVYRKLGVTSREEALTRAAVLGLL